MRFVHLTMGWLGRLVLLGVGWWQVSTAALARPIDITVLYTTDIHGHLQPTSDYDGNQGVGGMLRCATRIEQIRSEKENVLLVDCGDLIQGSAESYLTEGRSTIQAMEYLAYDAWTLGNHEFDWGLPKLLALHDTTRLPMLAANIVGRPAANPIHCRACSRLSCVNVKGVRVAVVGPDHAGRAHLVHS